MNLFQSMAMLGLGLVFNLTTIFCMHKSNQLRPFWSPYLVGIAISILLTQICVVLATRSDKLPLDIAIAVFVSFVMLCSALLIKTIDSTRVISGWEWFFYAVAIIGALGVGFARHFNS